MKSIKEKSEEYAKIKHTDESLIKIVSWDFEAGANYVIACIEELIVGKRVWSTEDIQAIYDCVEQLKDK